MRCRNYVKSVIGWGLHAIFAFVISLPVTSFANENSNELSLASTAKPNTFELSYTLSSEDKAIGSSRLQISRYADGAYQLREYTHIHTQGWWGELDIRSVSAEKHATDGHLVSVDRKAYDGDQVVWTQANTKLNELWLSRAKVEHIEKREEQALMEIALIVLGHIAPEAVEALTISQSLIAEPTPKPEALRVLHKAFDSDFNNLPFFWADRQYSLPTLIRLLDLDTLTIEQYQVSTATKTGCDSLGRLGKCQFYTLEVVDSWWKKSAPLKVWLAENAQQMPYFLRVEGSDEDGPFLMEFESGD